MQGTSQADVEAAVRAGATVISIVGKGAEEAIELQQFIPDSVREAKISCLGVDVGRPMPSKHLRGAWCIKKPLTYECVLSRSGDVLQSHDWIG